MPYSSETMLGQSTNMYYNHIKVCRGCPGKAYDRNPPPPGRALSGLSFPASGHDACSNNEVAADLRLGFHCHCYIAGVLTETTAELAVALTMAAARRVVEADRFMRGGLYKGWLPTLFVGALLQNKIVGIIGAGR